MFDLAEYFDWLVNEEEPLPEPLLNSLASTTIEGRRCNAIKGPVLTVLTNKERGATI